jgi:predicted lactoylglutathione lyase
MCDEMYHKAIALGAPCDGEPEKRIPYVFYVAYFLDLDGHKIFLITSAKLRCK